MKLSQVFSVYCFGHHPACSNGFGDSAVAMFRKVKRLGSQVSVFTTAFGPTP